MSGEWMEFHGVGPTGQPTGWKRLFDHSVLILSVKTLPGSYLVGATLYQQNNYLACRNNKRRPDYSDACHAILEFGPKTTSLDDNRPVTVTRRWTDWQIDDCHCVFNYLMLRLAQIDTKRPLYQFANPAALENAMGTIVYGRDLESLTCLFKETPTWLV